MSKVLTTIACVYLLFTMNAGAQSFVKISENNVVLDNGHIRRMIQLEKNGNGIVSNSLRLVNDGQEFLNPGSEEFSFMINGSKLTGTDSWKFISASGIKAELEGEGTEIILANEEVNLQIKITYILYPELPLIRKKISFINSGIQALKLESLDIERLRFKESGTGTQSWVMNDYARQKSLGQFTSTAYDPVVVVHQIDQQKGIVLGNEAPGVMKNTTAFMEPFLLTIGLTDISQNFGFRQWINPGESWESPWVFSAIYANTTDPGQVLNSVVPDYVRKHMGIRLNQIDKKPVFVYNTWEPFFHDINEQLIMELADAAAECGIEEFIIDDGWQDSYGDWGINKTKFPNGLKPVFEYIKSKGMKPGVWISLAAAESVSKVYKEHPEWLVRKADGSPINLHTNGDTMYDWETYSMCMTSGWKDYIKGIILKMVNEYGLEYIKADFAAVTGAYTTDKTRSGCYASNHTHKDRNESMLEMYQATWQLFDELHAEAPNLFIDCTFETMGAYQLIDLDMCKHAEGNWLSNFQENAPMGSMRVRQMAWWRSPVIPATAMVIGNQRMDDPNFELSLQSLTGTLPIVLGDPRLLDAEKKANMRQWATWLRQMQSKHDFMSFRQDLPGFGEPGEGRWDGFQRINTDSKSGGIIGVFKQGSNEDKRRVAVQWIDPGSRYQVKLAPSGELLLSASGDELMNKGFEVSIEEAYGAQIFEIINQ